MTAIKRSDEQPRRSEVATSNSCFSRSSKQIMLGLGRPRRAAHGSTHDNLFYSHCCLAITAFASNGNTLSQG